MIKSYMQVSYWLPISTAVSDITALYNHKIICCPIVF